MFVSDSKHGAPPPRHQLTPSSHLLPPRAPPTNQLLTPILLLALLASLKHHGPHNNGTTVACQPLPLRDARVEGGAARSAPVDTGPGPEFEEPVGNYSVAVGKDVQLPCKISRLAGFRSAWLRVEDRGVLTIHTNIITPNYRIGLRVEDEGRNFMLTIKNVQPSDRGAYMCQINTVPMRSIVGHLNVLTPPVFEEPGAGAGSSDRAPGNQPQAQPLLPQVDGAASSLVRVQEGANVTMSCRASGNPAPTISWRREDNEPILVAGPDQPVAKLDGPSLSLSQVSRLSSGAYLCIASNGVLPSPSRRLSLDVQFAPVIRLPQTEVGAQVGREARLVCYVDWNPAGSYHWVRVPAGRPGAADDDASLLESSELVSSDRFEVIGRQLNSEKMQMSLEVRKVDRADFGWYRCIASNALGSQSGSVRLHESLAASSLFGPGLGSTGGRVELATDKVWPRAPAASNRLKSRLESPNALQDRPWTSAAAASCRPPMLLLLAAASSCWLAAQLIVVPAANPSRQL